MHEKFRMQFEKMTAIVTGAASGMGLAASKTLRAAGANVVMCDVNEVALAAAAEEIGAFACPADVFKNLVSREYKILNVTEGGNFGVGREWKLSSLEMPERQRRELDLLYADMMRFVNRNGNLRGHTLEPLCKQ